MRISVDNMEIDDEEQHMDIDVNGVDVNDGAVAFGPLTHKDAVLGDIHAQILREIQENLRQVYDTGTQEDMCYREAQEEWWTNVV